MKTESKFKGGKSKINLFNSHSIEPPMVGKVDFEGGNYDPSEVFPHKDDYVYFPFRHLSATIVGPHTWKATEFPEKVLKKSMSLLARKKAFLDHWDSVRSSIGVVGTPEWQAQTEAGGKVIPAGINAPFIIDSKLHPDLVRRLLNPHGHEIDSASVSIMYQWEPSHEFEDEWDFLNLIGTEIDGEMVRRVATEIVFYYESSLVTMGADPFAKKLGPNGEPVDLDFRTIKFSEESDFARQAYESNREFFVEYNYSEEEKVISLQKEDFKSSPIRVPRQDQSKAEMDFKTKISETLSLTSEASPEELLDKVKSLVKESSEFFAQLKAVKEEKEKLEKEKDDLSVEVKGLKPLAQIGEERFEDLRDKVVKLQRITRKGELSDAEEKHIRSASFDVLSGMYEGLSGEKFESFGATCSECGSTKIAMRNSESEPTQTGKEQSSEYREDFVYHKK